MNIAIIGYGKMGREIECIAKSHGLNVASIIDPNNSNASFSKITEKSIKNVDVCIDYSIPNAVIDNIKAVSKFGINMVVGTTGWYDSLDKVKQIVKDTSIGFVYSSNFSIGVNVFFRIVEEACKTLNNIDEYDIYCCELHHKQKIDSPSGTAKVIGNIILKNIDRKSKIVNNNLSGKIRSDQLNIASIRGGNIPGTHIVGFDSEVDTIELKHTARSKKGFAMGSILAAKWLQGKKGFFEINDFMKYIINRR